MIIDVTGTCEVCGDQFAYVKVKKTQPDKRTCSKKCSYALRKRTRHIIHDPIEKECLTCHEKFLDTSKKKQVDRCKKCVHAGMVATRRSKGSYVRSEEQNRKLSETLKEKYESGWNPNTETHKEKLSTGMKARWLTGEMSRQTIETSLKKFGASHWTRSEEGRKVLSEQRKGCKFSEEVRRNMSLGAARRIRDNNNHYERGRGGYRVDLGHYVRSNWEANYARILLHEGKSYEYEPASFALSDGTTYTPDFRVDGEFHEVKGIWYPSQKEKFQRFCAEFPEVKVQIIDGPRYDELRSSYRNLINWEGK